MAASVMVGPMGDETLTVDVEHAGRTYRAVVTLTDVDEWGRMAVSIDEDGVWAGSGRIYSPNWSSYSIVDCAAILGRDQDQADEIYEMLDEAIGDAMIEAGEAQS